MKYKKIIFITILVIYSTMLYAGSLMPYALLETGADIGYGTVGKRSQMIADNYFVVCCAGVDINEHNTIFGYGEGGAMMPLYRMNNFVQSPQAMTAGGGIGYSYRFNNLFTLGARVGLTDFFYNNKAGMRVADIGFKGVITPRLSVAQIEEVPILYGFSFPVSFVYTGSTMQITAGLAVTMEVSAYYFREY